MTLYQRVFRPILFTLDAELSHDIALTCLKWNLVPAPKPYLDKRVRNHLFGLTFHSPVGLAAGFDKNAIALKNLLKLGFGFVEVGTVTPRSQPGNPKPRLFRLPEDEAIINRLGFNNQGLSAFVRNLHNAHNNGHGGIIGANVGKNKDTQDAVQDYVLGVRAVADVADYIVINVSSPNTPGLRDLQTKKNLQKLIGSVMEERATANSNPPVLLKIAPDVTPEDVKDIAEVAKQFNIDGLIATNTTVTRPGTLTSRYKAETGGLSGAPLMDLSTSTVRVLYRATEGLIPIVGVGGITSGGDAYDKIKSGASLVQVYSAMVYRGPYIAVQIAQEIGELLSQDGFSNISEAIGIDAR